MLNKRFLPGLILLFCALHASVASAVLVEVNADTATMDVGEIVTLDVSISDLGTGVAPSLAVFDIELMFDSSLFSVASPVTYGDQLSLLGFPSFQDDFVFANDVSVFELSFNSEDELNFFQADSFLLFSVQFEATNAGVGVFDLAINDLGDAGGIGFPADQGSPATVSVRSPNPNVVPLPAAVWLFATALASLIGFGRRRKTAL